MATQWRYGRLCDTSHGKNSHGGHRPLSAFSCRSSSSMRPLSAMSLVSTLSSIPTTVSSLAPSNMILTKAGTINRNWERLHHNLKGQQDLEQRLQWIQTIFADVSPERYKQTLDMDGTFGAIPGLDLPQQTARSELPHWVLLPSSRTKAVDHARKHPPYSIQRSGEPRQRSESDDGPQDPKMHGMADRSSLMRERHSVVASKRASVQTHEDLPQSFHVRRISNQREPDSESEASPTAKNASDEWRRRVLKESLSFEKCCESISDDFGEDSDDENNPTSWASHFGDKRPSALTERFSLYSGQSQKDKRGSLASKLSMPSISSRARIPNQGGTHSGIDKLNYLSEEQVFDLFLRARGNTMEIVNDTPMLLAAWKLAGYPYGVNAQWLGDIAKSTTTTSFLDADEFNLVWSRYFGQMEELHERVFAASVGEEGTVNQGDLPQMMCDLGFYPMPGALSESCQRMLGLRLDQRITLKDFHRIYNDLYGRAGLTTSEQAFAHGLFKQHADQNGRVDAKLLPNVLALVRPHYLLTQQDPLILSVSFIMSLAKELVKQVNDKAPTVDANSWRHVLELPTKRFPVVYDVEGTIDIADFLVACNILHQRISDRIASAADRIDLPATSIFSTDDVMALFNELGQVSPDIDEFLEEMLEDSGLHDKDSFSFAEVYSMFLLFCDLEALSRTERDELSWLFNLFMSTLPDVEKKDGRLCLCELKRALRWLCYTPTQHRLTTYMDIVGGNSEDYVDFAAFTVQITNYRYVNIGMARRAFRDMQEYESDGGVKTRSIWRSAPLADLKKLMSVVGHKCSEDEVAALKREAVYTNKEITWKEFLRLEQVYRGSIQETLKENLGFTEVEAALLLYDFNQNVRRPGDDFILYTGFNKILKKHLPWMPIDEKVRKLVKESDVNGNNQTEYKELLWIMRRLHDRDSKQALERAQSVMHELNCSHEEVREMRELFNMTDTDLSGSLDMEEVTQLFGSLVHMSHDAEIELHNYLNHVDSNQDNELDFWEFLRLVKTLESQNWRNILGAAAKQVHREEEYRESLRKEEVSVLTFGVMGPTLML